MINNRKLGCLENESAKLWHFSLLLYLVSTEWEEFPNGRWGNSSAATFGDISEHHLFYLRSKTSKEQRLNMWGRQLVGEEDVWRVFHNFITDTPNEESGAKVSTKNH